MTFDILIEGGTVALPELAGPRRLDVGIDDGRIAALVDPSSSRLRDARERIDARGMLVMPGAVDPHVHVSWPYLGSRTRDGYRAATVAAAAGGTTTIIDFAIEGRDDPAQAIERRRAEAAGSAVIDFGFHLVVSSAERELLARLDDAIAAGVSSFKCYMTYRRRGIWASDDVLLAAAARVAAVGGALGVHAENADLDDANTESYRTAGEGAARHLPDAKPPLLEAEAVARAGRLAAAAGARLWVLHLSSAAGLAAALRARTEHGQPTALETCPQYLLLDRGHLEGPHGHRWLCSPPLRSRADQNALWRALADGDIDWIGTDHCLFTAEQKDALADAFWDAPHGLPGVETRPGLILWHARRRGIALGRIVDMLATAPARFFGLYPRKGTLLPGSDADLALWDLGQTASVAHEGLRMPCDWNPYDGLSWAGHPKLVLCRGVRVGGEGVEAPSGHGEFLRRPVAASAEPVAEATGSGAT